MTDERSLVSSLEQLARGTQGVVAKRLDLALLDARELASRTARHAALLGLAVLIAAAAWLAGAAAIVLMINPQALPATNLGWYGALNAAAATILFGIAAHVDHAPSQVTPNGDLGHGGHGQ